MGIILTFQKLKSCFYPFFWSKLHFFFQTLQEFIRIDVIPSRILIEFRSQSTFYHVTPKH